MRRRACRNCGRTDAWLPSGSLAARLAEWLLPVEQRRCAACDRQQWVSSDTLFSRHRLASWAILAVTTGGLAGWLGRESREPAAAPAATPPDETLATEPTPDPEPEPVEPPPPAPGAATDLAMLIPMWAEAWSSGDVDAYLSFYSREFRLPQGVSRTQWETDWESRLHRAGSIEVAISDFQVELADAASALVVFRQSYRSDAYSDEVTKRLELVREDGKWKIVAESTDEVPEEPAAAAPRSP